MAKSTTVFFGLLFAAVTLCESVSGTFIGFRNQNDHMYYYAKSKENELRVKITYRLNEINREQWKFLHLSQQQAGNEIDPVDEQIERIISESLKKSNFGSSLKWFLCREHVTTFKTVLRDATKECNRVPIEDTDKIIKEKLNKYASLDRKYLDYEQEISNAYAYNWRYYGYQEAYQRLIELEKKMAANAEPIPKAENKMKKNSRLDLSCLSISPKLAEVYSAFNALQKCFK